MDCRCSRSSGPVTNVSLTFEENCLMYQCQDWLTVDSNAFDLILLDSAAVALSICSKVKIIPVSPSSLMTSITVITITIFTTLNIILTLSSGRFVDASVGSAACFFLWVWVSNERHHNSHQQIHYIYDISLSVTVLQLTLHSHRIRFVGASWKATVGSAACFLSLTTTS